MATLLAKLHQAMSLDAIPLTYAAGAFPSLELCLYLAMLAASAAASAQ